MPSSLATARGWFLSLGLAGMSLVSLDIPAVVSQDLTPAVSADREAVRRLEAERVAMIERVRGAVVAIYDPARQGGGSGVLVDPNGTVLTNHHVVMGAGVSGVAGLADGKLYRWKLVGTDPGGDLAIIRLEGTEPFPFAPIGNSDRVRVGDFAFAMGNPFLLAEDQTPTITMGIVSGVQRYQYGAGRNELVYGNCIQVDSSINPGNSGGPLFDLSGNVIGINGRGSFAQRGRVNVGLGYAISSNQVKNFFPDLLSTRLTEHGSLDAQFGMRGDRVVCETLNLDSPIARAGLALGDQLVRFQGYPIETANQFTNLITTMPAGWPATLDLLDADGKEKRLHVRLLGLPYQKPPAPEIPMGIPDDQRRQIERQIAMVELLRKPVGEPTDPAFAATMAADLWARTMPFRQSLAEQTDWSFQAESGELLSIRVGADRSMQIDTSLGDVKQQWGSDASGKYWSVSEGEQRDILKSAARRQPLVMLGELLRQWKLGEDAGVTLTHDGGDLANGSVCHRLRWNEADGEWWYVWVRAFDDEQGKAYEIVKAGSDRDGDPFALIFDLGRDPTGAAQGFSQVRVVEGLGETPRQVWGQGQSAAAETTQEDLASYPSIEINPLYASAVQDAWRRTVKVYGATAGNVEGYATGLIVSPDGDILTGTGVYLTGSRVRVAIPGKGIVEASLVRQHRRLQLALLKVDTPTPDFFDLSTSSPPQRGDWVLTVSNAFKVAEGDEPLSVSLGIVSLPTSLEAMRGRRDVAYAGELVLIDAISANPGAAGGAVITPQGQLVGMIGRVIESGDTNTRLNYAVPAEALKKFLAGESDETTNPTPTTEGPPGELGIRLFGLGGVGGDEPAYVDRVVPGSAAAAAGIRPDDLVVSIDGERIGTVAEYRARTAKVIAGVETVVVVKRGDELLRLILIPKGR